MDEIVPQFLFQMFNFLSISRMLLIHNDEHKFIVLEDKIEYTLLHM